VAEDTELHRMVALKEIKPEYAQRMESRGRFVLEAEVTGRLEHPGIVPVYGLGAHADGRPYYAMRFIRGDDLAAAVAQFHARAPVRFDSLEFRGLLGRFVAVCQTVAYAHSRGVLHRDLKPGNIRLGKFGETLVLDWGLAKVTDRPRVDGAVADEEEQLRPRGEGWAATEAGTVMGTPAFMSPEQARGGGDEVGLAADVYGLGASLYALLTNRAPFRGEVAEVLAQVQRGAWVPARQVNPAVPAALDAICRKAMAPRPEDRYASALELAKDVEAWLADEPVGAYREPAGARVRRWVRKHPRRVTAAVVLLLATVVGLTTGTVLLGQANRRAEAQRDLARKHLEAARKAVDDSFTTVSESTLLKSGQPGLQKLRKQLLESALRYYKEFVRQRGDDPELREELAQAYFRVGSISLETGDLPQAREAFHEARNLYRTLQQEHPDDPSFTNSLARTCRYLGIVQAVTGRGAEAASSFQQAIDLGEGLVRNHPRVAEYRKDLGWAYNNLANQQWEARKPRAALTYYEKAVGTWRDGGNSADVRNALAQGYSNLGLAQRLLGRPADARRSVEQAVAVQKKLADEDTKVLDYQIRLFNHYGNLGYVLATAGHSTRAFEAYRKAIDELGTRFVEKNPDVPEARYYLADACNGLGDLLVDTEQAEQGLKSFQEGLKHGEEIARRVGVFRQNVDHMAISHRGIGKALRKLGKPTEALASLKKAIEIEPKGGSNDPRVLYNRACTRALCSAVIGQAKRERTAREKAEERRYANEAVRTLQQYVGLGYCDALRLKSDPDFNAIRSRKDFRALVREAEQNAKGQGE
jgi:eukaryotic-like serine/threonine-protein kinase